MSRVGNRMKDYVLIAGLHSAALAGRDGSISWSCVPRFDPSACFASLPQPHAHLETTWKSSEGAVRRFDFMTPRGVAHRSQRVTVPQGVNIPRARHPELAVTTDRGGPQC